jgi:Phage small terminase subunit
MLSPAQRHQLRMQGHQATAHAAPGVPSTAKSTTPAQRHQMRLGAQQVSAESDPGKPATPHPSTPGARASNLMRVKLGADIARLKKVQSVERKVAVKAEVLPDYVDYIAGVIAADKGGADPVVGHVFCWRIDVGDWPGALELAHYVLKHKLPMPDNFKRTTATLLAEEPAVQALRAYEAKKPFDVDVLRRVEAMTRDHDMPDQVRAKLLLAMGRLQAETEPAQALNNLRRAVELHSSVGAKKDIESLERKLRNPEQSSKGDT